jgi:RNA polymerase sigma-70 factor (ECF subfamily)
VEQALDSLDPEQREVIVLRDVQGFDYAEIAEILSVPAGTVKSRLHRARAALRERLRPWMVADD